MRLGQFSLFLFALCWVIRRARAIVGHNMVGPTDYAIISSGGCKTPLSRTVVSVAWALNNV